MEMRNRLTRRGFLRAMGVGGLAVLAGACAQPTPTPTPKPQPTAAAAATQPPVKPTNTPVPTLAPKPVVNVEGYTFFYWSGYTGKEKTEFIDKFKKDNGRPPKDEEIPTYNPREFWNTVSAKFKEAKPEYNITWDVLAWADGRPKIDIRVAAGDPPDLVAWSSPDILRFALINALVDLKEVNDTYRKELLYPDLIPKAKGTEYGMPLDIGIHTWQANRALFRANGVEDLLPSEKTGWLWSHDTFLEACKAMTKGTGNDASYGMAFWGDWHAFYPLSTSFGAPAWNAGGDAFILGDDERGVKGCQFMVDLVQKYKVTPPDNTSSAIANLWDGLFTSARLGMKDEASYGYERAIAEAVSLGKLDPKKVEVVPVLPPCDVKNGAKPQVYGGTSSFCAFKQKKAERSDGAKAFLVFLAQPEYAKITFQYAAPFRTSQVTADDQKPERQAFQKIAAAAATDQLLMPYWVSCRPIINPMWEALIAQTKPIPELLKDAKTKVAEFIQKDLRRLQF